MAEAAKKPFFLKRFFSRIGRFFKDLRGETKKVVWPTKKQIINNTLIVIAFVILAAIFIGCLDLILSTIVEFTLQGGV